MKTGILASFIFAGVSALPADVYVGGGIGFGGGVVGGVVGGGRTATTTTTTTTTQSAPEISVSAYEGGESPMSASEAAWILARTNLVTGAALGDQNGLSEQAFAIASLLYKTDYLEASATFIDLFNVAGEIEGKLYALMGMRALTNFDDYKSRVSLIDPKANVNCLVNGKFYVVTVETFLKALDRDAKAFIPSAFPSSALMAQAPTSDSAEASAASTTTTSTTTTSSTSYDYNPVYYWGWTPSYVWITYTNYRRPAPPPPPRPGPKYIYGGGRPGLPPHSQGNPRQHGRPDRDRLRPDGAPAPRSSMTPPPNPRQHQAQSTARSSAPARETPRARPQNARPAPRNDAPAQNAAPRQSRGDARQSAPAMSAPRQAPAQRQSAPSAPQRSFSPPPSQPAPSAPRQSAPMQQGPSRR